MKLTERQIATLQDLYYHYRLFDGKQPRMIINWALSEFTQSDYRALVALNLASEEVIDIERMVNEASPEQKVEYEKYKNILSLAIDKSNQLHQYRITAAGIKAAMNHLDVALETAWRVLGK